MTTTISLSEDTKDRFDELRPGDVASADEFLGVLLDNYDDGHGPSPDHTATVTARKSQLAEAIADEVAERVTGKSVNPEVLADALDLDRDKLDRIESAASTAEERTGRIEQTLEELGGGR